MGDRSENKRDSRDKLNVLIALAAQKTDTRDPCPLPEQIAALIESRLETDYRDRMLAHIEGCPDCYHVWLETALSDTEYSRKFQNDSGASRLIRRNRTYLFSGLGAVAAAVIVLFIWIPLSGLSPLEQLITNSYEICP